MNDNTKEIHKWFPFLNSWKLSEEPKMMRMINQRKREIKKAERMSKGLDTPFKEVESCEC